jgi:hypothetical protein
MTKSRVFGLLLFIATIGACGRGGLSVGLDAGIGDAASTTTLIDGGFRPTLRGFLEMLRSPRQMLHSLLEMLRSPWETLHGFRKMPQSSRGMLHGSREMFRPTPETPPPT